MILKELPHGLSDIELLKLVAKAAGYNIHSDEYWTRITRLPGSMPTLYLDERGSKKWAPLDDDGDALRLLIDLGVGDHVMALSVGCSKTGCEFIFVTHGKDPRAATRRAIVLAAARIGYNMRPAP